MFVKPSFVLEDLQRDELLLFVIEDPEYDAKGALAKLFDDFVPVAYMLIVTHDVLLLVRVEAIVRRIIQLAIRRSTWLLRVALIFNPFLNVEEVYCLLL